jgi:hypothetical protein
MEMGLQGRSHVEINVGISTDFSLVK